MFNDLLFTVENGIATVTVNRPKSLNSLTANTFCELSAAFEACQQNEEVRAVVVKGEGKNFSSGGDVAGFGERLKKGADYEASLKGAKEASRMTESLRQCFKPTVAMVSGVCFGAGLSLALACDFRIIEQKTRMCTGFINAAFSGDSGTIFHLKEMVGFARMTELMMTGRVLQAEEIMQLGLATQMAEEGQLHEAAYGLASRLAKGPTATFARQKQLFWQTFYKDYGHYAELEAQYMAECSMTQDFIEAVTSFLEKRPPQFAGK